MALRNLGPNKINKLIEMSCVSRDAWRRTFAVLQEGGLAYKNLVNPGRLIFLSGLHNNRKALDEVNEGAESLKLDFV